MSTTSGPVQNTWDGPAGGACPFQDCCALCDRLTLTAPGLVAHYRREYCTAAFHTCARYLVAERDGPDAVSCQLLPTDLEKAGVQPPSSGPTPPDATA